MNDIKKQLALLNPLYWPAWLGLGILWLITRLPERPQFSLGKWLGRVAFAFNTKIKRITLKNISLCFPQLSSTEQFALAKKNFESMGLGIIEAARAWWLSDAALQHAFEIEGLAFAEEAFAKGKGIILVGPHFMSLEMIGRILGMHYEFAVMYRPHKKPIVSFIHERFRSKYYKHYIPRHRVRELIRTLHNNIAIWYAYDIDAGEKNSVFAPFFNIPAASLTSVSRLVNLSNAAVVPIYFYRDDHSFNYKIILSAPLNNFPTEDPVADAARLNHSLETAIRQKPEQYIWQYKRFKTRPAGQPRFY